MQNKKNKRVEPNGLFYFGKEIIELQRDKNFAANKTVQGYSFKVLRKRKLETFCVIATKPKLYSVIVLGARDVRQEQEINKAQVSCSEENRGVQN